MEKRVRRTANCSENKDCISELPDEILVCILSRLTLREAVVTSVLSRRWEYLWASIYTLDFDHKKTSGKITLTRSIKLNTPELTEIERPRYVNWVNRVLEQHRGPTIDQFRVWFDLDNGYARDINRWIMFAMQKRVQRLEIHLSGFRLSDHQHSTRYTFPDQLLLRRGCFKSLKDLTLRQVNVSWEVVDYFLANCPNLERLFVHQSNHLKQLSVVGSSLPLKHLGVYFCTRLKSIKICDTNLVSFKYVGPRIRLLVNNAPLLVDVSITERMYSNLMLRQFSSCFSQLQILTLSKEHVQDKIKLRLFTGLMNLKKLVLEIGAEDDESLLLFTPLVEACPYLQIFVFKIMWTSPLNKKRRVIKAVKCPHYHLKVVEIGGYYCGSSDFELAMYFIDNATILEKIIIDPRYQCHWHSISRIEIKEEQELEQTRRHRARQQLESKVRPRVKLEIL
ncbi:F-box/LRR-repeat protein At3g26922-like isoform X2 [Corylus avellana]|nr:F-box/LRR-repeat protein At3g26922-like isoform X2 [Corylus avellana]